MWFRILCMLPLIYSAKGIRVPVDHNDEKDTNETPIKRLDPTQTVPVYYVSDDANVDSYLIPPDPHKPEEVLSDVIVTPATYLLPPTPDKRVDYYYNPTEPGQESDWYPIAHTPQIQIPIQQNLSEAQQIRRAKQDRNPLPVPSTELEPPLINAPNDYLAPPSEQINIPIEDPRRPLNKYENANNEQPNTRTPKKEFATNYRTKVEPTLALRLIPPQPNFPKPKTSTKLYPKKFPGEFKPVPIPIAQYTDESASEIPRARPVKLLKPLPSSEIDYLTPTDEKINYLYRKAELKRKLKGEEIKQQPQAILIEDNIRPISSEQDTSATHFTHPGRNAYPSPLRQAAPTPQHDINNAASAPAPDERTEFRMHGMKGPHSYQFGFDTGKGKNRQFRYEERDNDGIVRGHYGYMDKRGKLRVVNYSADPKTGFQADAPVEKE